MWQALLSGAAAGYGIAIPVGAIGILIVENGVRRGLRVGFAAGAGAATVDGVYAVIAALFGVAIAGAVGSVAAPLRVISVVVLMAVAARGLAAAGGSRPVVAGDPTAVPSASRTYLQFVGLTLLNPMTVTYFVALILGLPEIGATAGDKLAFAAGAFAASLSWQSALAAFGSILHHRLPARLQVAVSIAGNLVILAFAAVIARGLL
jgi:threonine/homoserine/homoserine lactone efflux protein